MASEDTPNGIAPSSSNTTVNGMEVNVPETRLNEEDLLVPQSGQDSASEQPAQKRPILDMIDEEIERLRHLRLDVHEIVTAAARQSWRVQPQVEELQSQQIGQALQQSQSEPAGTQIQQQQQAPPLPIPALADLTAVYEQIRATARPQALPSNGPLYRQAVLEHHRQVRSLSAMRRRGETFLRLERPGMDPVSVPFHIEILSFEEILRRIIEGNWSATNAGIER